MSAILGPRAFACAVALVAVSITMLFASPAMAGRLVVTGHDAELHCSGGSQCHFLSTATNYVRGGAPDPTKPVLVLDTDNLDFPKALDNAYGVGVMPRVVMDPKSAEFASAPLSTSLYSAILVASDDDCGGCDLNQTGTEDSDAINARTADIASFFNEGGGIYVNAGDDHGNGDPSDGPDVFYNFVPIPLGGVQVYDPFTLTPAGVAFGLEDSTNGIGTNNDINCCATHNSFAEPTPGSPLIVLERNCGPSVCKRTGGDSVRTADGDPETMSAEGFIVGGQLVTSLPKPPAPPPPVTPAAKPKASASISGPSGCTSTSATIRVRGQNISTVTYSLDGKRTKKAKGNKTSVKIDARHLKSGVHRVTARVTYTSATAAKAQTKRFTLTRCARKAAKPKFTG